MLDAEGWFHTGDLGELDAGGNLYFKGREKNVIVTPAGLKIYPQDLEAELRKEPQVRDCIVVGIETGGARDVNAEPCAVILLRDISSASERSAASDSKMVAGAIVESANARLAPFQEMRRWMVWRDSDFPALRRKSLSSRKFARQPKWGLAAARRRRNRKRRLQRPPAQHQAHSGSYWRESRRMNRTRAAHPQSYSSPRLNAPSYLAR